MPSIAHMARFHCASVNCTLKLAISIAKSSPMILLVTALRCSSRRTASGTEATRTTRSSNSAEPTCAAPSEPSVTAPGSSAVAPPTASDIASMRMILRTSMTGALAALRAASSCAMSAMRQSASAVSMATLRTCA
jgi:hypothetical protein